MSQAPRAFSLELPADPAYVATARMFGAAIARHAGIGEEGVEDLKLGISEACAVVMREGFGALRLRVWEADGSLDLEVLGEAGPGAVGAVGSGEGRTPQNFSRSVAGEVLEALFADATIEGGVSGGSRVAFSVAADRG
jgi:hypothetical protein